MLFFIDESWQSSLNNKHKVGVLSAIQIDSRNFNEYSSHIFKLKSIYLGVNSGEIKGKELFNNYHFKLESKGIKSIGLELARDIFNYMETLKTRYFASIVFSEQEIDLACNDANQLERPYFFLFERIDLFMKESYPTLMAKLVFDDRGVQDNKKISKSISNFFHKCSVGQKFDSIIKVPLFAISSENVGIQMADIGAYLLGKRFTGDKTRLEFFKKVKGMQFISDTPVAEVKGKTLPLKGFKVIKEK
ncbi:MAG: DUF3800 domain-containing protein [Candidatus Magnetominusculus sp. LBB02]|nr:DUF3800 domain-containing protein [Candidatus Magnetominusculus sp. LBB02]